MSGERYSYVVPYRRVRVTGAVLKSIAVCPVCMRVVRPSSVAARGGARARGEERREEHYVHEHELQFVVLERTCNGLRRIAVPPCLERWRRRLEELWVLRCAHPSDIEDYIDVVLELEREGEAR